MSASSTLFSTVLVRSHEFDAQELHPPGLPQRADAPCSPDIQDVLAQYVLSLPHSHNPTIPYPWNDAFTSQAWYWQPGSITPFESLVWFLLLTHPDRLRHTRGDFSIPQEIRYAHPSLVDTFDARAAKTRLATWFGLCEARSAKTHWHTFAPLVRFLGELLDATEILDMLFELVPSPQVRDLFEHLHPPKDLHHHGHLAQAIGRHLGALDLESRESIYVAIRLLERLPCDEHAEPVIRRVIGAGRWDDNGRLMRDLIMTLQDPKAFATWFERAPSWHILPEDFSPVFGKGGWDVVAALCERVIAQTQFSLVEFSNDLFRLHCPEVVPAMLDLARDGVLANAAHSWLVHEGYNAIEGAFAFLTPVTKRTEIARKICKEVVQRGHHTLLHHIWSTQDEKTRQKLAPFLLLSPPEDDQLHIPHDQIPDAFYELMAPLHTQQASLKMPPWLTESGYLDLLPPLLLAGARGDTLAREVTRIAISVFATQPHSVRARWAEALAAGCEPSSLTPWASMIYAEWIAQEENLSRGVWIELMGRFGDDHTVMELKPQLGSLIKARQFTQVTAHLRVIAQIGTKTSLAILVRLEQTLKIKRLHAEVVRLLDAACESKGLSKEALYDYAVPLCGFDPHTRTQNFDYGDRQFRAFIDTDTLKPLLQREGEAKRLKSLPQPRTHEDLEQASHAKARWTQVKKEVSATVKSQTARLEHAMVERRRWSCDTFSHVFLEHPVMAALSTHVVFATFDAQDAIAQTFRLTAEFELLDEHEEPVSWDKSSPLHVGIPHPLDLGLGLRKLWTQILLDDEVHPLFPQLDRPMCDSLTEARAQLDRLVGARAEAATIRGRLTSRGWSAQGYLLNTWTKSIGGQTIGLTLWPGFSERWNPYDPPQTIGGFDVDAGVDQSASPLLMLSEVLLDLRQAFARDPEAS